MAKSREVIGKVDRKMSLAKYFFLHTAFAFLLSLSFSASLL